MVDDTTIIQITDTAVVGKAVLASASGNAVLLTEGIVERLVIPVVRCIVIGTVIVAESSVRIDFEVSSYQLLPFRNGIDLIAKTSVVLVKEVLVGVGVRFSDGSACIALLVVHQGVPGFVVKSRIVNHIIIRDKT